ncbi:FAD binding domain-containing protein [Desulfopila inferna]|mgnify:CR=1 FL=1|uniref:FAD binding domain-containing protein n=1 Tax=Desulfopila inferna TaxID=468528 RepID=UPI0019625A1B|nr:xanthine dehydrogenase family protein subunit M [Desulfopila inferna]MBM9603765.1 xanthine dehydrogenase family protein subunit M [Desulfopila inferna]
MLPKFAYVRPLKLDEAITQLRHEGAWVHAGGTDLLGCLRERIIDSRTVVSISGLKELKGIRKTNEGLQIGALTTITEISENSMVKKNFPGLSQGAAEVASPQLRNQGTIGGNLCQKPRCWYYRGEFHCLRKGGERCFALGGENQFHAIFGHNHICAITHPSDTAPVLVACDGVAHVAGPDGNRNIAIEDLHVLPQDDVEKETALKQGEIITHITVPDAAAGQYSSYRKIRARRAWDFALAGVALVLGADGGRISRAAVVLSGAAPVPWRSTAAEEELKNKALNAQTIAAAASAAVADAEPLNKNRYKIAMFRGMLEEELAKAGEKIGEKK